MAVGVVSSFYFCICRNSYVINSSDTITRCIIRTLGEKNKLTKRKSVKLTWDQHSTREEENDFDEEMDPLDFKTPDSVLSLSRYRIPRGFTITTDSYISLCSRVYAGYCAEHLDFANNISESAFQYYAIILLWKRFAEILPACVTNGSAFFKNLAKLECTGEQKLYIPVPLLTYLKGIGNFCDLDDCERQFLLPILPVLEEMAGVSYTFGKVNAKTHFYYEAFPAPGIAVLRILADIRYTKDTTQMNLIWDLPERLRLDLQESHVESSKPTKNLLGWAPAQFLSDNQLQLFESLNIDENFIGKDFSASSAVHTLFQKIKSYLAYHSESDCIEVGYLGMIPLNPFPRTGSLAQGMFVEKHFNSFKFDRCAMYCEGNMSVCSQYNVVAELAKGAVLSGYRMAKEPIGDRHCWACYDFDEYKSVPESWKCCRNTVFTFGSVGKLNETMYRTGCINKRVLQNECILHTMFEDKQLWNIYF